MLGRPLEFIFRDDKLKPDEAVKAGVGLVLVVETLRAQLRRVYILEKGLVRWNSSMTEFLADEDVRRAYLAV